MNSERLKPEELDAHIENGTFRLSFVGMSNAGKSYRSKILEKDLGFLWYQVDEKIQKALNFSEMSEISSWLGYPTNKTYKEREKEYLKLESQFTREAAMNTGGKNLVFDTTGSVIHLDDETIETLKNNCLLVHLDVGEDSLEKMTEKFFIEPKPVCWSGYFNIENGESEKDALKRCYPKLLKERLNKYRNLAHLNIPSQEFFNKSAKETISIIRSYLR